MYVIVILTGVFLQIFLALLKNLNCILLWSFSVSHLIQSLDFFWPSFQTKKPALLSHFLLIWHSSVLLDLVRSSLIRWFELLSFIKKQNLCLLKKMQLFLNKAWFIKNMIFSYQIKSKMLAHRILSSNFGILEQKHGLYLVQPIEDTILRIPNLNSPNLRCCQVLFFLFNITSYNGMGVFFY